MTVLPMKNVTLNLAEALPERNANLFVTQAIVLEVLIAMPETIGRPVLADIH
jgi:hypothetical protein